MTDTQRWKWTTAHIALAVVALPLFVAVLVWTWEMSDMARGLILLGIGLNVGVIGTFFDARAQQNLDEMEIAARGFAARWSIMAIFLLVLFASVFEPFRSWLNEIYPLLPRHAHAEGPEQMFVLGVLAALVVRGLGAMLLRAAWMHAKR